ncbi:MAG: YadA-like family protein, partial [Candidatus Omnitrophica bacterium]|nr:YadA-like family protein [Candidatus Omnitrophota bacterium]
SNNLVVTTTDIGLTVTDGTNIAGLDATATEVFVRVDDGVSVAGLNVTSTSVGVGVQGGANLEATADTISVLTADGHGLIVDQSTGTTTLSGGTTSTTLTLDDSGATFSNSSGNPVRVTGVANGTSKYDAVNYGQLKEVEKTAYSGIASVAAMAAIPAPAEGKRVSVGIGYGNFKDKHAVAAGAKLVIPTESTAVMLTGAWGYCDGESTLNAGIGWSW